MSSNQTFDVAVIGAGVFGAWSAHQLSRAGATVALIDAYGPGNSRSSSGGESRMIRMGYGPDEIYTRMAQRSLASWKELFNRVSLPQLFQPTGILWLAHESDSYCISTKETLERCNVQFELLDRAELGDRYPQLQLDDIAWGILEPNSGVLMAREAVKAVVSDAQATGVSYFQEAVVSPRAEAQVKNSPQTLLSIETASGKDVFAGNFVFACGPWLPKLFPTLLSGLIHVTRQEVIFFGVPAGDDRFNLGHLPAWIDFHDLVYGLPNLDNRGFKLAIDQHGSQFDPDLGERVVSADGISAARSFLVRRMPSLAAAPVTECRVCQYENTSNGNFLIDRHPAFMNVWLVGGGSGHGFKHGPAIGEYVSSLIMGKAQVEPRFSLATKKTVQRRTVY
jgi:monomeric sarcosine oxidase